MNENFEDQIRELMNSGNKIAAIKRYREETGAGLADAKAAVEALEAGGSFNELVEPVVKNDPHVTAQIVELLLGAEKIKAIKLYRQRFGVGLKEAKEAVESIGDQNGIPNSSGIGCLGAVLLAITSLAGFLGGTIPDE